MNQRRGLVAWVLLWLALSTVPAHAAPITLRFTNNEVDLGQSSIVHLEGHEYSGFGITTTNLYRYVEIQDLDPFSDAPNQIEGHNLGVAAEIGSSGVGRIDFIGGTSFVTFDWFTLNEHTFNLRAFDAGDNLVGSFLDAAGSGSHTVTGPIAYITFNDGGGFVAIANLTWDTSGVNTAPVLNVTDQTGTEGTVLTFPVTVTDPEAGGEGGQTITVSASNLPLGATFTQTGPTTGTFTWTPNFAQGEPPCFEPPCAPTPYVVQFTASDGQVVVTKSIQITIADDEARPDEDQDGVPDDVDNCPEAPNPSQQNVCQNTPQPSTGTVVTAGGPTGVPVLTYNLTVTAPSNTAMSWAAPGSATGTVHCDIYDSADNLVPPERIPEIATQVLDEESGFFVRVNAGQTVTLSGQYDLALTNPNLPDGDYTVECVYRNFTTRPDPQLGDAPVWVGEVAPTTLIVNASDAIGGEFFLHGPTLSLNNTPPTSPTAAFVDTGVALAGGNQWKVVGQWNAAPGFVDGTLEGLGPLQIWLGLTNSDAQGLRFDIRAEILKNGAVIASGLTRCITGVTRDANRALRAVVPFAAFTSEPFDGGTDVLALRISARVGTTASGAACGGHVSGGLRVYFDAVNRRASFTSSP
jgi:hypothetical protein